MTAIVFTYWPSANGEGHSGWRISRDDLGPVGLLTETELRACFRRASVPRECAEVRVLQMTRNFQIVTMPAGISSAYRARLRTAVAKALGFK